MSAARTQVRALLEVLSVFVIVMVSIVALQHSALGTWQVETLGRPFVAYAVMMAVPFLFLCIARRYLPSYGLSFANLRYQLNVAWTCCIPLAVVDGLLYGLARLDPKQWKGALVNAAANIVLLILYGWLLRQKAAPQAKAAGTVALLVPVLLLGAGLHLAKAGSAFLFYLVFVGLGEETLYRGYIQSRLNQAFGRPYRFFGIAWGAGAVLAALFFALMHVLNLTSLASGRLQLAWWWGAWTFFAALTLGLVREKTGTVVAPAIVHGLPQAIAYAFLGF